MASATHLRGANFVHKVSNQFIFIDRLFSVQERFGLSHVAFVCSFALGGCDFCPGTAGVPQLCYLKALVNNAALMRGWRRIGSLGEYDEDRRLADIEAVILTALAFVEKYGAVIPAAEHCPSFLGEITTDSPDIDAFERKMELWMVRLRKAVFAKGSLCTASLCLPETEDVILQGRRCAFVLKYWQGSVKANWTREEIGGVDEEFGYCADGVGDCWPLCERQDSVLLRRKAAAYPFTSCGCSECKNRTCSCRKVGLVCIPGLCRKCEDSCQNKGVDHIRDNVQVEGNKADMELEGVGVQLTEDSDDDNPTWAAGDLICLVDSDEEENSWIAPALNFDRIFGEDSECGSECGEGV